MLTISPLFIPFFFSLHISPLLPLTPSLFLLPLCPSARIQLTDPDVVAGHNFVGFDLDVLLHGFKACNLSGWSKLGRMKRTHYPRLQPSPGGMGDSTPDERAIMSGRLICDTYLMSKVATPFNFKANVPFV